MKKSSKNNSFKELYDFFAEPLNTNQKAWTIIHDFYHFVLTHMERNKVTKSDLAKRLNKSRSAISQMFNKSPNVSVKKLVEIADAVGIEFKIVPTDHRQETTSSIFVVYQGFSQTNIEVGSFNIISNDPILLDLDSDRLGQMESTVYAQC